jgi:uncharacterized protein YbjT (DUF2867 family)
MEGDAKMADEKTILVTGATGAQGGSVARYLLKSGDKERPLRPHPGLSLYDPDDTPAIAQGPAAHGKKDVEICSG